MADDQQPFPDELAADRASLRTPMILPVAEAERRFWAEVMLLAAPIFLAAWGAIALFALTHGGTQAGTFLGIVWPVVAVGALRQPYVAILRPDGSPTFKALTRTVTTTADSVYRIRIGGGRGRVYVFQFDDRRVGLADSAGGRCLATCSNATRRLKRRGAFVVAGPERPTAAPSGVVGDWRRSLAHQLPAHHRHRVTGEKDAVAR